MSNKQRYETGKAPQVTVETCEGDLVVRSWSNAAVVVEGGNFEATENESGLAINSQARLKLTIPAGSSLFVQQVQGDFIVKNVSGDVAASEVNGDAVLSGLGLVKFDVIHNDLSARNIDGPLSAGTIHGDAVFRSISALHLDMVHGDLSVRYANGEIQLGEITGDVGLRTINGDLTVAHGHRDAILRNLGGKNSLQEIEGDIRLYGGLAAGKHTFKARGDIILRWPVDAPLNLIATAPRIANRLSLDEVTEENGTLNGRIGDGETTVILDAQGSIVLKDARIIRAEWEDYQAENIDFDFAFDLGELGERISSEVNAQVARVTTELENKFGPDFRERITEDMNKKAEQAVMKAEKALHKLEREIEKTARKQESRRWSPPPPPPPKPKPPKKSKATAAEQLKILKMVENGAITPDEAATLLDALEE